MLVILAVVASVVVVILEKSAPYTATDSITSASPVLSETCQFLPLHKVFKVCVNLL